MIARPQGSCYCSLLIAGRGLAAAPTLATRYFAPAPIDTAQKEPLCPRSFQIKNLEKYVDAAWWVGHSILSSSMTRGTMTGQSPCQLARTKNTRVPHPFGFAFCLPAAAFGAVIERAVFSHLLLHTRLEGKARLHFTLPELARKVRISRGPVRAALHRLASHGALRFIERSYSGHLVEIRLPAEVPAARRKKETSGQSKLPAEPNLEELDFLRTRKLRQAMHAREGGKCFYCRRRIPGQSRCLDHVLPRAKSGLNSYRNLVSCCAECNWQKGDRAAADFLREMYREGRLSREEFSVRLRALRALVAGELRPQVLSEKDAGSGQSKERALAQNSK
jgi:5-methylcytosine-specific restriction endonuclease McrA